MKAQTKNKISPLLYGILLIGVLMVGVYIYFSVHPEDSGWFPQCIFHSLTGYDCPGCGSQRVVHSLLHFEFRQAFFYNPLLVVSLPYILLGIYIEYFGGGAKHPGVRDVLYGRKAIIAVFVIVILFWIGRNMV